MFGDFDHRCHECRDWDECFPENWERYEDFDHIACQGFEEDETGRILLRFDEYYDLERDYGPSGDDD